MKLDCLEENLGTADVEITPKDPRTIESVLLQVTVKGITTWRIHKPRSSAERRRAAQ